MVIYFESSTTNPPTLIYMGKDKHENEELIKFAFQTDIWFHVDKLSSAHVYLRINGISNANGNSARNTNTILDEIPPDLVEDVAQLTKANSIEGNKKSVKVKGIVLIQVRVDW